MKLLISIITLGIAAICFTPRQANIGGTWILSTPKQSEKTILRLQMGEGYYKATVDLPAQQIFDRPVQVKLDGEKIHISLDPQQNCVLNLTAKNNSMEGTSTIDGKTEPVKFVKLNQ